LGREQIAFMKQKRTVPNKNRKIKNVSPRWPELQLDVSHKLMWNSEQCPRCPARPTPCCTCYPSCLPLHKRPRTGPQTSTQHHGRSRKTSWWYHCKFQSTTRNTHGAINALLLERLINLIIMNPKDDEAGGSGSTLSGKK